MQLFAKTAERIAATTKKLEKTAILAEYLKSTAVDDAAVAATYFSGRPFPMWEETTLQVGGTQLWQIVRELSGKSDQELTAAYRQHGDLGAVAEMLLPQKRMWSDLRRRPSAPVQGTEETSYSPTKVQKLFREIAAARGSATKGALVRQLLSEISPLEAKYIVKIMTGDLRIGLKESLVEEAIAKAYTATLPQVQRANMLLGDVGETLQLAAGGQLNEARMRLFHPIAFMLASPADSAEDVLRYFQGTWVEDKYDGIRAQAHCSGQSVRFFSRTRDEITESFPELPEALRGLPQDAILDGEIVAWSYLGKDEAPGSIGRALPFSALQRRLGRKKVSENLMQQVPVAYLVFDLLYAGEELLIDWPLRERAGKLESLLTAPKKPGHQQDTGTPGKSASLQSNLAFETAWPALPVTDDRGPTPLPTSDVRARAPFPTLESPEPRARIIRAPTFRASSPEELNLLFDLAQARGNEGLMIKDPESPYTPGRRGKSWLKLKRELATLDVVVTEVEWGHGKRIGVLSDYTFAVRHGDRLLNVGKAYSGLTDAEIAELTKWFLDHTIEDQGFRRVVQPEIVLEVAFNNVMKSDRHASGYALRFPRIVRLRPDKLLAETDSLERVKEIYAKQEMT